mmetsp:Transcript_4619/g.15140  ORF Transcript_4619/g.15140 Transcript_4619/m.15140 type:complete len:206 (-) Transcript_4619:1707-2324(-)
MSSRCSGRFRTSLCSTSWQVAAKLGRRCMYATRLATRSFWQKHAPWRTACMRWFPARLLGGGSHHSCGTRVPQLHAASTHAWLPNRSTRRSCKHGRPSSPTGRSTCSLWKSSPHHLLRRCSGSLHFWGCPTSLRWRSTDSGSGINGPMGQVLHALGQRSLLFQPSLHRTTPTSPTSWHAMTSRMRRTLCAHGTAPVSSDYAAGCM